MKPAARLALVAAVVAVVAAIVVFSVRGRRDETLEVYAQAATAREVMRQVKATGAVDPRVKVKLSSPIIGRIERLYVAEGDSIAAGAPVLELEKQAFVAARDQAAAQLASARTSVARGEADFADARLQRDRAERLAREGIVAQERVDAALLAATSAELALAQARESVRQSQAALDRAADDLSKTTIFSPLAGRVVELSAEEGEVVVSGTMNNPASVIGTVADLSEVLAVVDVDETEIVEVAVGQPAEIEVEAVPDTVFPGEVVEVGSSGTSRARQPDVTFFKVKVLFAVADPRLRPGMSARVRITTQVHGSAVAVPVQAVVEREPEDAEGAAAADADPEKVVFVVEAGVARRRKVETGIAEATDVEIVSGLAAGEQVVTGPYRTLRDLDDGDAIAVVDPRSKRKERKNDDGDDEGDDDEDGDDEVGVRVE